MTTTHTPDVWADQHADVDPMLLDDFIDRSYLLPIAEVTKRLAETEPIEVVPIEIGPNTEFWLGQYVFHGIEAKDGSETVPAKLILVGLEGGADVSVQLTKDALLEATSACGLPKGYVMRCPPDLIQDQLNYWFRAGLKKPYRLLIAGQQGVGIVRGTLDPYSNMALVDAVVSAVQEKFAASPHIFVDAKFVHSVRRTHIRLVIPALTRYVESADHTIEAPDLWSVGLNIQNSIVGEESTMIDGYLYRWQCRNGAIDMRQSSGAWSRRTKTDDVYEWAHVSALNVLDALDSSLHDIQHMTSVKLSDDLSEVLRDVFNIYRLPVGSRSKVIEYMANTDDLTMYGVMSAVTAAANEPGLSPTEIDTLLRIGGDLPTMASNRCEACHRLLK